MTDLSRRTALGVALGAAAAIPLTTTATAGAAPAGHGHGGHHDPGWTPVPDAVPVPLDAFFDNDGIDTAESHDGDFDGSASAYPGEELPPAGPATVAGVKYVFPSSAAGAKNNIVATGQRIPVPEGSYLVAYFLVSCSYGNASGTATVSYSDGSTSAAELGGADWYSGGSGVINTTYRYRPGAVDQHPVAITATTSGSTRRRKAVAITLPDIGPVQEAAPRCTCSRCRCSPPRPAARCSCSTPRPRRCSRPAHAKRRGDRGERGHDVDLRGRRRPCRRGRGGRAHGRARADPSLAPGEQSRVRIGVRGSVPAGTQRTGTVR